MSTTLRAPHRMTVAEFQDWEPPADLAQRRWELVDGEPVCMSPPSIDHGAIQSELARLLGNWLTANRPDCRVITTPGVVPRVRSDVNERIPDLAVTCGPIRPARTLDDPILLIEILSPSNEAKTRANVWAYATIPSVREIVLISSTSVFAEIFRRNADNTWPPDPLFLRDGAELDLESIGMALPLQAAYRTSSLATSGQRSTSCPAWPEALE
jgi:Uma2 family endonuclease